MGLLLLMKYFSFVHYHHKKNLLLYECFWYISLNCIVYKYSLRMEKVMTMFFAF